MVAVAAPHALLVVNWGDAGAALLSVPTREYFQASGWTETGAERRARPTTGDQKRSRSKSLSRPKASTSRAAAISPISPHAISPTSATSAESVKSGSQFWADGRGTPGTGVTGTDSNARLGLRDWDLDPQGKRSEEIWHKTMRAQDRGLEEVGLAYMEDEGDDDATDRENDYKSPEEPHVLTKTQAPDETGAHSAFVAGLLFALSKRVRFHWHQL
jgi:hypothetical protein